MDKVLGIGSVVVVDDARYVVIGHRMCRDGENVGLGYLSVPYPIGFASADSLGIVPASRIEQVLAEGYDNAAGAAHRAAYEEIVAKAEGISYDDYADGVLALKGFVAQEVQGE